MKPQRVIAPDRLADRFHEAVYSCGCSGYRIPLTALATANTLLGAPAELITPVLRMLAGSETAASWTRNLWQTMIAHFPYLGGRIEALTGWLDEPQGHEAKALTACFGVLAGYDLPKSFDQAGGDLLGPVYMMLRSRRDKQAQGAFYTPMNLSYALARMVGTEENSTIGEPCCGAGGMVLGMVRAMRESGQDPDTCTWVLNDLDPVAVALAGVNMASHGMTKVSLTCGNGLLLGTGTEGDPLLVARKTPGNTLRDTA